ncbi:formyl transferase [Thalassotalea litorea]|uniref:Formyl transferase n=1 Tax=Thalassotalea litorea TaxID=2020715 RepID=A0A5R9J074_9GAMM|nr:formyl transferase [Thalassotalea litorea]TLU67578.1 formyl transferase [Thalassotalea litorea]
MNITFLVNRDLASNFALNLILPTMQHHNLTVFLSDKVGNSSDHSGHSTLLADMESKVILPLLESNRKLTGKRSRFLGFNQLQCYAQQPLATLNDINQTSGLAKLTCNTPDLIISIRFGKILQPDVIKVPRFGVINLHSGLLPQYRGVMATFWAMLNGEKEIGTTLHTIDDSGIDTGQVIAQSRIPVQRQKSYLWHVLQLYLSAPKLLQNYLQALEKNIPMEKRVQSGQAGYYSFPKQEHCTQFLQQGLTLFDTAEISAMLEHYYRKTFTAQEALWLRSRQ